MSPSSLQDSVQEQNNTTTKAADSVKDEKNTKRSVNDEVTKSDTSTKKRKYSIGNFPEGYRFCPYDYELIVHYLKNKVTNQPLPHDNIKDVDLYKFNPFDLAAQYPPLGDTEWYFFSPRDRKYANGERPNRRAGDGYWKATGSEKSIGYGDITVGFERALVFYTGKPPNGDKTTWIMHEYRMNQPPRIKTYAKDMRLDDWVLCKIYEQGKGKPRHRKQEPAGETKKKNRATEIGQVGSINADASGGNKSSDSQTLQFQQFYNHRSEEVFMQLDHDLQNWEMINDDESLDIQYLTFSTSPPDSIDSILDDPTYSRTPST